MNRRTVSMSKQTLALLVLALTIALVASCAPAATPAPAPTVAPQPTAVPPTEAPAPTAVPPTEAPAPTIAPEAAEACEPGMGVCPNETISPSPTGRDPERDLYTYPWNDTKASKRWKICVANWSGEWDYTQEIVKHMEYWTDKWGVDFKEYNNAFDTATAFNNADLAIADGCNAYLQWHIDAEAIGPIGDKLVEKGIIYIPMDVFKGDAAETSPTFYVSAWGYGNMKQGGEYLGKYIKDNWDGKLDLVIQLEQPRAGEIVASRFVGYRAGLESVLGKLPDEIFVSVDGQGTMQPSVEATAPVLTAHPDAKYILLLGSNDDDAMGAVRAAEAAGRTEFTKAWGQPGLSSGLDALKAKHPVFMGSSWIDIEKYVWPVSLAIDYLEGRPVQQWNWETSEAVTADNVNDIPPQYIYVK